ncbi:MAG: CBS domain-containing protein [Candidatus Omnitrophica bacterium]|jgi:CBS domain-containing protein/sporulation protein YlmC with PRC-barrel domain|nr:CBS domain-containing protein [Candidatus Omnitrophota bacterium]
MINQTKPTPNPIFIYFSQIMENPVIDKNGEEVGSLYDIIIKPSEVYPQSSHLIIRKGFPNRQYAVIAWADILEANGKEITLRIEKSKVAFSEIHNNKEELTLRRDILDQQVVDTYNHKVIRINDIHLLLVDNHFMAAHVDISSKGLLRRLGFLNAIEFIIRLFNKNSEFLTTEPLISWKHIHPLSINPVSMTIKVNVPEKQLNSIPAADLGEIFLDLDIKHKIALFKAIDINAKAKIFVSIDFKSQKSLIEDLKTKEIADILNAIPSDEATDFLEKLPKDTVDNFLNLIESKRAKKLSQLLGYSNDSAGGLMTTDYLAFHKDTTVESVLTQIKERSFKTEAVQFVYIVDESNHLLGATNFRHLLRTNLQDSIQKAAFPKSYFVHLNSTVKEVAYLMDKYKYFVIPVVDDNNVLQGIVTVDDILSQVISIAWRRLTKIKIRPKQ